MKYRILSHTADLRLEVYGKTLEELFINAAEALARILYEQSESTEFSALPKARQLLSEKIEIQSVNMNTLLVDFLNEILARSHINKAVYKVESLKLKGNAVEAKSMGKKVEQFDEDVKAVTYHEVDIKEEKGMWHTTLILDI